MKYKTFLQWLEMKSNPPGSAGGSDLVSKAKQQIIQQAGQPGTSPEKAAEKVLQNAAKKAQSDPNEDIDTAVEIGTALDKVKKQQKENLMKKMKK